MNDLLKKLLDATRLPAGGSLSDMTAAIRHALAPAGPSEAPAAAPRSSPGFVFDGLVREVATPATFEDGRLPPANDPAIAPDPAPASADAGARFAESTYTGAEGTRAYKLFEPAGHAGRALPLIVMLHGCTQDPDDFAAGTRMNEIAQRRGFRVLYPAQAPRSNASKCWNWFTPGDQKRGLGEPSLIVGMTRQVMRTHPVDADRVYVAGLSAGGSMAAILAHEYPDVYAAAGVHSGLPPGAAHDVASAFAAMQNGAAPASAQRRRTTGDAAGDAPAEAAPTIVFHGDRDTTVHPSNGAQVVGSLLDPSAADAIADAETADAGGRRYTRTVYRHAGTGPVIAEHWVVHGAGHAWSGGSPAGTYTDPDGPDATLEMVRFFEEHARAAPA